MKNMLIETVKRISEIRQGDILDKNLTTIIFLSSMVLQGYAAMSNESVRGKRCKLENLQKTLNSKKIKE